MISAILAGGGRGSRSGDTPKAFINIGEGPLLYYSLEMFNKKVDEIVLVLPTEYVEQWKEKLKQEYKNIAVIPGGTHRQDSVQAGLNALKSHGGIIIIHDIARPLFSEELLLRVIEGAETHGAAVPYVESQDTLKERESDFVKQTPDRDRLVCIQTPQAFTADIIRDAYAKAYKENFYGTDDASLVERAGGKVYLVKGERENFKITYPMDITLAKEIIKKWKKAE
ncbi:MAG: 2-C-methyl-D-erythritol 4-phosphate cytidylyltransferase [Candidatus Ratteibacteria bacterium]|jgi:2-C-methyl-D-erythritol 4-phosphate cytidylyltransferase